MLGPVYVDRTGLVEVDSGLVRSAVECLPTLVFEVFTNSGVVFCEACAEICKHDSFICLK